MAAKTDKKAKATVSAEDIGPEADETEKAKDEKAQYVQRQRQHYEQEP